MPRVKERKKDDRKEKEKDRGRDRTKKRTVSSSTGSSSSGSSSGSSRSTSSSSSGSSSSSDSSSASRSPAPKRGTRNEPPSKSGKRPSRSPVGAKRKDSRGRKPSPPPRRSAKEVEKTKEKSPSAVVAVVPSSKRDKSEKETRAEREKSASPKREKPSASTAKVSAGRTTKDHSASPPPKDRSRSRSREARDRKRSPSPAKTSKIHIGKLTRNVTKDNFMVGMFKRPLDLFLPDKSAAKVKLTQPRDHMGAFYLPSHLASTVKGTQPSIEAQYYLDSQAADGVKLTQSFSGFFLSTQAANEVSSTQPIGAEFMSSAVANTVASTPDVQAMFLSTPEALGVAQTLPAQVEDEEMESIDDTLVNSPPLSSSIDNSQISVERSPIRTARNWDEMFTRMELLEAENKVLKEENDRLKRAQPPAAYEESLGLTSGSQQSDSSRESHRTRKSGDRQVVLRETYVPTTLERGLKEKLKKLQISQTEFDAEMEKLRRDYEV